MAVPPNLVKFAESAGLFSVDSYGPDSQQQLEAEVFQAWFKLRNPIKVIKVLRQAREYLTNGWTEMSETLTKLAVGADLILSGTTYQEVAANVAEAQGAPELAPPQFTSGLAVCPSTNLWRPLR
jgi:UDP:flavonoid glycosyltransferase YjiC (YdhE family)